MKQMPISFPIGIQTMLVSRGKNKKVFYPRVFGLQDPFITNKINQEIVYKTQELINHQIEDSPSNVVEMLGFYEIKNNQRDILSISLSNYTYHYQAAHGMTYIKSLTFSLEDGKQYKLKDLFKDGSDYKSRISGLIQKQIEERDIPLLAPFTEIGPTQDYYIADKSIIIYFQLYELSPYVFGFPMFPISVYELEDIIDEGSPLSRMAMSN